MSFRIKPSAGLKLPNLGIAMPSKKKLQFDSDSDVEILSGPPTKGIATPVPC